jgi:hypothetical protein
MRTLCSLPATSRFKLCGPWPENRRKTVGSRPLRLQHLPVRHVGVRVSVTDDAWSTTETPHVVSGRWALRPQIQKTFTRLPTRSKSLSLVTKAAFLERARAAAKQPA